MCLQSLTDLSLKLRVVICAQEHGHAVGGHHLLSFLSLSLTNLGPQFYQQTRVVVSYDGLSLSRKTLVIRHSQSQKHGNMTFPLDGVTFAFFGE